MIMLFSPSTLSDHGSAIRSRDISSLSLPTTRAIQRCTSWRSYNAHRPHRSLHQRPPMGDTPRPSGAAIHVLRRDRLGGLLHEYVHVA